MENMNNIDSFWGWVRKEKFSVYFSLSIFIIPYAYKLLYIINGKVSDISFELVYDICHVIFILISLIMLTNSVFLMDVNGEGNKFRLFSYVKEVFGENSNIVKNGQDGLFRIVEVTIRQFYYSWIVVWCIWLLMYVNNLVFCIYSHYAICVDDVLFRYKCFFENILNLSNSFVLFFIYFVITISSVNVSTNERNQNQLHTGVIVLVFLGMIYFAIDYQAIFISIYSPEYYNTLQFYLRIVVGISATVALMGVLGRLNSSFLNIPQGLIICLYVYASLQMIYPMTYENLSGENLFNSSMKTVRHGLYVLAFAGKVCLFFVIRWIIQKRRFMFFVIHKAHSYSESENMLKKFNRFMGE